MKNTIKYLLLLSLLLGTQVSFGESQGGEYKGVTDPFGDPANYEFSEDEKDDKEFFHLGRYIMLGIDLGVGFFTGELGRTNTSGFEVGAHLVYFFDKNLALEAGFHYSQHTDTIVGSSTVHAIVDTTLTPITAGFRYYFDTKNAPRAIALANPYLVMTGGIYNRTQTQLENTGVSGLNPQSSTSAFGIAAGGGAEFNIYKKHIYLGADLRYHFVFFSDESDSYVLPQDRSGDFFTGLITLTYNY